MSEQVVTRTGHITYINRETQFPYIQIDGVGPEGVIIHIDDQTDIRDVNGEQISIDNLQEGMTVLIHHRLAMTMSLPPQTYAFSIQVV